MHQLITTDIFMNKIVFIDTCAWFAGIAKNDQYHETSKQATERKSKYRYDQSGNPCLKLKLVRLPSWGIRGRALKWALPAINYTQILLYLMAMG
jgi:hypothetical protein